ncbi:MAG: alpha/beta hydrolase, partial [Bacteroidota bacterium]
MKKLLLFTATMWLCALVHAQDKIIPLWPGGIPCENNLEMEIRDDSRIGRVVSKVHRPELAVYPAQSNRNGTSVLICPGGGYTILAWDWEGTRMAEWFNSFGVTAFVLKSRLPHWESEDCRDKVALMDAQRAMRIIRSKASEYQLHPDRIGVMGFSAGGHLASSLSTHYDAGDPNNILPYERFSSRPDFSILMYPVVTMQEDHTHKGSRNNLIGKTPAKERASYYSNEAQVTEDTPPAILIHANNDKGVVPENSVNYYMALRRHGVPAALHIYEGGGHGFSFAEGMGSVSHWPEACRQW